jgi:hypothetical protein
MSDNGGMKKEGLVERMQRFQERHAGGERRTIFLDGKAVAVTLVGALGERVSGAPWYEDQFQRGMFAGEDCASLVVLATMETLDSERPGAVHITLTTHGLDDDGFTAAQEDWWSWWSTLVDSPQLTVA